MTILVTGAAGRTSSYVIEALFMVAGPVPPDLRLLVRSEKSVEKVMTKFPQLPPTSFVVADYLNADSLPRALNGCDIVFHNGPAFHSQETAMGIALIDAAKAEGVKHFVYCSVLFPLLAKLINHKAKLGVEEYLIESGLNYTILEPTSFMQNIDLKSAVSRKILPCGYSPTVLQGFADLQDLAAIAALVILDPAPHNRARYEIVSENATLEQVASTIARLTGSGIIKCELLPRDQVVQAAARNDETFQEGFERMLYYYDRRGIPGNSNTVRWLLGREPNTWESLIRRDLEEKK